MEKLQTEEISKILDIREPFLMIESISIYRDINQAEAVKILKENEWFFKAHLPSQNVMPASLIIEGMLQTLVLLIYKSYDHKCQKSFIYDINSKIISGISSKDKLIIYKSSLISAKRGIFKGKVDVYSNSIKKATGIFSYASPHLMIKPKD